MNREDRQRLSGEISINRTGSAGSPDYINIEISDRSSFTRVLSVVMSMESFAEAITGRGSCACQFTLYANDRIGKLHQTKEVLVPWNFYEMCHLKGAEREQAVRAALAPFEVDGWEGDESDLENGHRIFRSKGKRPDHLQRVIFRRWVDPPPPNRREPSDEFQTCAATYNQHGEVYVCALPEGHDGDHSPCPF